ncbi:MAG: tripartite tricarboxylate transporter TctB family protein [Smithellaceae bacterium]|nr:tripartite tricarboxylate transporter TctB family protein [Smithellaceae bacterium]
MKKDELVANGVAVLFFSSMLFYSFSIHGVKRVGDMGGEFWPVMILSGAVALSIALFITSIKKYLREKSQDVENVPVAAEAEAVLSSGRKKYWLSVICLLTYIVIMPWIGFIISSLLFVYAFILALEERRRLVLALAPALVTALTVLVFGRFLNLPLPRGGDFFAAISRFIY